MDGDVNMRHDWGLEGDADAVISVPTFKKTGVIITILLSLVTLGIYIPYWFLSRRDLFNSFNSKEKVSYSLPLFVLILYSFSAIMLVATFLQFLSEPVAAIYQYCDTIISYLGIVITLLLSFRVRAILNDYFDHKEVSAVLTFFFNIWYLQYKINQHFTK